MTDNALAPEGKRRFSSCFPVGVKTYPDGALAFAQAGTDLSVTARGTCPSLNRPLQRPPLQRPEAKLRISSCVPVGVKAFKAAESEANLAARPTTRMRAVVVSRRRRIACRFLNKPVDVVFLLDHLVASLPHPANKRWQHILAVLPIVTETTEV